MPFTFYYSICKNSIVKIGWNWFSGYKCTLNVCVFIRKDFKITFTKSINAMKKYQHHFYEFYIVFLLDFIFHYFIEDERKSEVKEKFRWNGKYLNFTIGIWSVFTLRTALFKQTPTYTLTYTHTHSLTSKSQNFFGISEFILKIDFSYYPYFNLNVSSIYFHVYVIFIIIENQITIKMSLFSYRNLSFGGALLK